MCNEKWILYNWWWPPPVAAPRSSKALITTKITPKAGHGHPLLGGLLPIWSTAAFWIPAKPLHLRSMLSKLIRYTENYNACSGHWSTNWAHFFFPQQHPTTHCTTSASKTEWIGLPKFCLMCHFPDLLPTSLALLQASQQLNSLLQEHFYNQQEAENAFQRVRWILKHGFLCYRNKKIYFS